MTNKLDPGKVMTQLDYIQRDIADIKQKLEADYVTTDEFEPIKKIVYGMVTVILLAVIGALVNFIIRQP